jgi:hypothetical protein
MAKQNEIFEPLEIDAKKRNDFIKQVRNRYIGNDEGAKPIRKKRWKDSNANGFVKEASVGLNCYAEWVQDQKVSSYIDRHSTI